MIFIGMLSGAIFIRHHREKLINEKLWHSITIKPANITHFIYYVGCSSNSVWVYVNCLCKLSPNYQKQTHGELKGISLLFFYLRC